MDLQIEANRNSALFNTMQQVLDVYNPLLTKARPTTVNASKHRIQVTPTRYANTFDTWNGQRTVRFDLPRIGSLMDFTLKCAFRLPGVEYTSAQREKYGDKGLSSTTNTAGGLVVTRLAVSDTARGRLDRVYADRLLGFNMIREYTISSKSRRIFTATGEYLLTRFSQMDKDMKEAVLKATTPVDIMSSDPEMAAYYPATTYFMSIPLYMFINEHITSSLDVNFSEEVHIDLVIRSPSELFWYGQLGDTKLWNTPINTQGRYVGGAIQTEAHGSLWDQSGDMNTATPTAETDNWGIDYFIQAALRHIQGIGPIMDAWGAAYGIGGTKYSGPTFSYPNVHGANESPTIQFAANADYLIQDTDAYRALRAQQYPEGQGLTTIQYDTAQETFSNLWTGTTWTQSLLDTRSGGSFTDPSQSASGINMGDSTRYVDLQLKVNNLCQATHFMVRKHSDLGGDGNTVAGNAAAIAGGSITFANQIVGAHNIYTRCLPVHYFQLLAAGRVIYESDGDSQQLLTQSNMYNGTGGDWGTAASDTMGIGTVGANDPTRSAGRPMNIYSINFGLQANRLENTGCLSYQNLNNPILRIYFKPELWAEYSPIKNSGYSQAMKAAALGVQVDVLHEFFNVVTINSGNGEITSGLNQ